MAMWRELERSLIEWMKLLRTRIAAVSLDNDDNALIKYTLITYLNNIRFKY